MKLMKIFAVCVFILYATGCATTSRYDQYSYMQSVNLKVDSINVMGLAVESYSKHKPKVQNIKVRGEKVLEYEKGRPKNQVTTDMWELMFNPKGDLLGGFFLLWEESETLGLAYIQQKKKQISVGFDDLIGLESKKIKK